jgi:hypothetical protein
MTVSPLVDRPLLKHRGKWSQYCFRNIFRDVVHSLPEGESDDVWAYNLVVQPLFAPTGAQGSRKVKNISIDIRCNTYEADGANGNAVIYSPVVYILYVPSGITMHRVYRFPVPGTAQNPDYLPCVLPNPNTYVMASTICAPGINSTKLRTSLCRNLNAGDYICLGIAEVMTPYTFNAHRDYNLDLAYCGSCVINNG